VIIAGSGAAFDPAVVAAFVALNAPVRVPAVTRSE
jgi:hypothetical protein